MDRVSLGFLASLDFNEIILDLEDEAKLECSRVHASQAVAADEMSGCIESEQLPNIALNNII